jgi:hypothetical protein
MYISGRQRTSLALSSSFISALVFPSYLGCSYDYKGYRVRSWLRHCATSWKVAGSITDGVTGIFQ